MKKKYILGIETSCDETSVAVIDEDLKILSNVVSSQIDIHKEFGGVIPEIAARNHVKIIDKVFERAIRDAGIRTSQLKMVAATTHPGLPGAVMVGRVFAESVAVALDIPFVPVNHIHGHIASVPLSLSQTRDFDFLMLCTEKYLSLVVSGGHTALYLVNHKAKQPIKLLERTTDDAVGEAFDKIAKVLGLAYPGGPEIAREAEKYIGDLTAVDLIKGEPFVTFVHRPNYARPNFSYSGLKTAVLNYVNKQRQLGLEINVPHIAASFQNEAVAQLVVKSILKLRETKTNILTVSGGVSANEFLRVALENECEGIGADVLFPAHNLTTDNAAMIAAAATLFEAPPIRSK